MVFASLIRTNQSAVASIKRLHGAAGLAVALQLKHLYKEIGKVKFGTRLSKISHGYPMGLVHT